MMKLEVIIRITTRCILGFFLFALPLVSFSVESLVKRYFEMKDYSKIIKIITTQKSNKLYGVEDYRICGETAFMYGLYEESCKYYQKVLLVDKKGLTEQDLINLAFSLLKLGKSTQLLTNPCFLVDSKSFPWLNRLKNIAATRDKYLQKKDTMLTFNNLSVNFLPQYGIDFYGNRIYFSCPRFPRERKGLLSENSMIHDRSEELAGIKRSLIGANRKAFSPEEIRNKLRGSGRVATINLVDEEDNYFATVVSRRGLPERIALYGNLFPSFPYNSEDYACAMPFYNAANQLLYFCSNMPGGYGGWDIYYSEFKYGNWEEPVNVGPKVNTPFDELFPSILNDKLIFSAEAREGLGGFDNYMYSFTDDVVINLWPFNTPGDDLSLRIIQEDPLKAIGVNFPDAKFSTSDFDLYTILKQSEDTTAKSSTTNPVIHKKVNTIASDVTVKRIGETTKVNTSGNAKKSVPDTNNNKVPEIKKVNTAAATVHKLAAISPEKTNKESDESFRKQDSVTETQNPVIQKQSYAKGITIQSKKYGEIPLGSLFYDLNNVVFKAIHYVKLDSIAEEIQRNDYSNIIIWSFTDRCGEEKYNSSLSYQRALGVVEYLKSKLHNPDNKLYFTISARESFSLSNREVNALDRRVEIYARNKGLPFNNVFAFKTRTGESFESIARIFNNNIDALIELNTKTPEIQTIQGFVYVGIQGVHVVSEGETLFRISQNHNCSVDQILKANHKIGYNILVGERLVIPMPFLD